ncbi:MAG: hypothetical protein ACO3CH_00340 [Ilumatobacteraceae bacterium]
MKYSKEQIASATTLINAMKKDAPTGIRSDNFPWRPTQIVPWRMNLNHLTKTVVTFRQDELHTSQQTVSKETLCSMVSNPEYVVRSAKPEIVRVDGLDMILNGHHRLATYWIYGEMEVECLLIEAEIAQAPRHRSISY